MGEITVDQLNPTPGTDNTVSPYSTPEFCNIFVHLNDWVHLMDNGDKYAHIFFSIYIERY